MKVFSAHHFAQFFATVSHSVQDAVINISSWSATVLTPPALKSCDRVFKYKHRLFQYIIM